MITFGFFGFWHVVLYILGWSERPFMPNRRYKVSKVVHNMWYSFLGELFYRDAIILILLRTQVLYSILFGRLFMYIAVQQKGKTIN